MKLLHLLEAPIGDFGTIGNFDDSASMAHASDRRAVTAAPMVKRIKQAWERTPFNFNLFFANVPGMEKYMEQGYVSDQTVQREFPDVAERILAGRSTDAITVVFTNNEGDERVSLTPWIIAHRIGHALVVPNNTRDPRQGVKNRAFYSTSEEVWKLYRSLGIMVMETFGINLEGHPEGSNPSPIQIWFELIGTMKSARNQKLIRPGEFTHELFAQYLLYGGIKFNPIDEKLVTEFGKRFGREVKIPNNANDWYPVYNQWLEKARVDLENGFKQGLESAQGKIIFM